MMIINIFELNWNKNTHRYCNNGANDVWWFQHVSLDYYDYKKSILLYRRWVAISDWHEY